MERNTAIILTAVSAILCGCPGLAILCVGSLSTLGGLSDNLDGDAATAIGVGLAFLCIGVLMAAVPVAVGVLTLRSKPGEAASPPPSKPDEPLPPAI
jgi:hypothetical protein